MWFSILVGELLLDTRDLHYASVIGFAQTLPSISPNTDTSKTIGSDRYEPQIDLYHSLDLLQSSSLLWVLYMS